MLNFTQDQVEKWFSTNEIKKARPYAAKQVLDCHWNGDELLGEVKGSSAYIYSQAVYLVKDGKNIIRAEGYCSCPVGFNCKHVAALLLFEAQRQLLEKYQLEHEAKNNLLKVLMDAQIKQDLLGLQNLQAQRHQDSFGDAFTHNPQPSPRTIFEKIYHQANALVAEQRKPNWQDAKEYVVWLILPPENNLPMRLVPKRGRLLKNGQWSDKLARVSRSSSWRWSSPGYISPIDAECLQVLEAFTYDIDYVFEDAVGSFLLTQLLDTGRLFVYAKTSKNKSATLAPIQLGEELHMTLNWQQNTEGHWGLQQNLSKDFLQVYLFNTQLNFVLAQHQDSQQWFVHWVNSALPLRLLNTMRPTIYLPQEQLLQWWGPLIKIFADFPALPQAVFDHLEIIPPQAILQIRDGRNLSSVTHLPQPLEAVLLMAYGDVEISPLVENFDPFIQLENRLIQRDSVLEDQAITQLLKLDLELDESSGQSLWRPKGAHYGRSVHQAWLSLWPHFQALQAQGWRIRYEAQLFQNIQEAEDIQISLSDMDSGDFLLEAQIETPQGPVALMPILMEFLTDDKPLDTQQPLWLKNPQGGFIRLEAQMIAPILQTLKELFDRPLNTQGAVQINRLDAMELSQKPQIKTSGKRVEKVRQMMQSLKEGKGIEAVEPPATLQATLRPYQQQGVNWLHFLAKHGLGGLLADDMGLGKTLQVIAFILGEVEAKRLRKPVLVVAPTSLVGNWIAECHKFAPNLAVLRFDGSNRRQLWSQVKSAQVVVTSYALVQRDMRLWQEIALSHLILDEAQTIKNTQSKTTQAVKSLQAEHRLCLTGTPLENHLGELWSLFDFAMPGLLGTADKFKKNYRNPIENQGSLEQKQRLSQKVAPFMLRRSKSQVVTELPPKTEMVQLVPLEGAQRQLYATVRLAMESKVQSLMAEKGLNRSRIEVLDALLKLRQVCCDPRLVKIPEAEKLQTSAKLDTLVEMVTELVDEGRKILIFSQFATMLALIESRLASVQISTTKLTGQTRKRQEAIDAFTQGEVPVFLISLKAGGVGLNLTQADTVIHYDPWWNPAAESQATDRAYRIGQDKPVFVYKLIAEKTVEEKILQLQDKKRALADSVFGDNDSLQAWQDAQTILSLFSED